MQNKRRSILFALLRRELGHTQNEARITILPSLRLGGSQQPQPLLVVLRRGFNPIPRPFPSPGEGMQPLASARSVTKVSATHQRVAGRYPTQQSCDCLCSLRSPKWRLFMFARILNLKPQTSCPCRIFLSLIPSCSNFSLPLRDKTLTNF